jgi:hypothetical protein
MMSLTIMVGVAVVLAMMAFITKRRLGILGLALAAGALLAANWTTSLTPFIQHFGVVSQNPPLETVVGAVLILLPSLVLLFGGPTYSSSAQRFFGSLIYGLLGLVLLLPTFGRALILDGPGHQFYDALNPYRGVIIIVAIIAALADVLLSRKHKKDKDKKSKK